MNYEPCWKKDAEGKDYFESRGANSRASKNATGDCACRRKVQETHGQPYRHMSTSPEAKQAAENERDPAGGREIGYYVQQAIDAATAKLPFRDVLGWEQGYKCGKAEVGIKVAKLNAALLDLAEAGAKETAKLREELEAMRHFAATQDKIIQAAGLAHQQPSACPKCGYFMSPENGICTHCGEPSAPTPDVEKWSVKPVEHQDGSPWPGLAYVNGKWGALNEQVAIAICSAHNLALAQARAPFATANLRLVAAVELLREVMRQHADKESCDYNECDVSPCQWCEEAAALTGTGEHGQGR